EEEECINNNELDAGSNLKEVAEKQKTDPELKQLIDFLTEGILPTDADAAKIVLAQAKRDFELVDGVLFHFWYPRPQNPNAKWKKQFCVPKSMQADFLAEYHDAMGHLGIRKTFDRMASSLHWKTMHADVEKWIQSSIK